MTAILLIAVLVALIWGGVVFLRGGLLGGCLLVLLAGCCFGHAFFSLRVGPVPLTADRLLWVALLVHYAVWRRWGLVQRKPLGNAELVLFAFFGVLALSTFSHASHASPYPPAARLLFYYVMPLGLYWVARQISLTERGAVVLFGCLGAFSLYLAVTALAEAGGLSWLVYPRYIGSPAHAEFLGRARGPLLNPAGSGLFQGVCLVGLLMWWPRLGRAGRLALVAGALIVCLGIYCTLTRSVWLGAGLGLMIFLALTLPRSWRGLVLSSMLLAALVAGTTQWERILTFKRDRDLDAQETAESVRLRPILAAVAWNMFLERPLLGHGLAQYDTQKVYYLADRSSGPRLDKARHYTQHNVFLSLLVETGLVGMGLFVALLALWVRDAWRVWRLEAAPSWARGLAVLLLVLVANYVVNGMFHDISLIPMVNTLLFFLAGIVAGLRGYASPTLPATPGRVEGTATGSGRLRWGDQPATS